jgi:hypothetical protein
LSVPSNHDGVVGDAEVVEPLQQRAYHVVVFHHAVGVKPDAGAALCRRRDASDVHASC